jgi:tetratricopeptide (TPR) repeat protein
MKTHKRKILLSLITLAIANCSHRETVNEHFRTGNEYAKDGLYKEAINSYNKAAKVDPDNPTITRNSGIVQLKLGNYEKAAHELQSILPFFASNYETNYYLAEALRNQGDIDNASYQYRKALEIRPKDSPASKGLAWCLLEMNRLQQASDILSESNLSNDAQAVILKSKVLASQNNFEEAIKTLNALQTQTSAHIAPYISSALGDVYLKQNLYQEAKMNYLEALKTVPLMYSSLFGMARTSRKLGEMNSAQKYAEQASRVQPRNAEPWREIVIIARMMKDQNKAKIAYIEYRKRTPSKAKESKISKTQNNANPKKQIKM